MNRRAFLLGGVATAGQIPLSARAQWPQFETTLTCLVINDITAATPIEHMIVLFDALYEAAIPFTCLFDSDFFSKDVNLPENKLIQMINAYSLMGDLMEVAAMSPNLSIQSEYFQSRHVYEANSKFISGQKRFSATECMAKTIGTVAHREADSFEEPTGVRSAGVRTVLVVPEKNMPVKSERWSNGVVRIFGGTLMDLSKYDASGSSIDISGSQAFLYLTAASFEKIPISDFANVVDPLVENLTVAERRGKVSMQRSIDIHYRDQYDFKRNISVLLEKESNEGSSLVGLRAKFVSVLKENGVEVTTNYLLDHAKFVAESTIDVSILARARGVTGASQSELSTAESWVRKNREVGSWTSHESPFRVTQSVTLSSIDSGDFGVDSSGSLRIPSFSIRTLDDVEALEELCDPRQDFVLVIGVEVFSNRLLRQLVVSELSKLAHDGVNRVMSLEALTVLLSPRGPELNRQRRTSVWLNGAASRQHKRAENERELLLEDAKVAWSYFEAYTNSSTGLCPATVNFSASSGRKHPTVTMWDVGSHINALISAEKLAFISKAEFEEGVSRILRQISGRFSDGRLLPQGWLRVDRQKYGNRDFDGSDAGRLLSSLGNLREYKLFSSLAEDLVSSWDLGAIVVDGHVHSVIDSKLQSVFRSHSAHYTARAFRKWGMSAESPYEVADQASSYDGQMELLEVVSWIGPIGAEPLILEALDLGMSRESAYLAEVLYGAQVEEYLDTGRLVAVSEGPIDVSPWFTYQGLQLDATKRTWALDTVGHDDQYMSFAFWHDHLVLSSKAAYLWDYYRPDWYSKKLVGSVRENARTKHGFASSTFSSSGRVTESYTDINTNSIILQSVQKILESI